MENKVWMEGTRRKMEGKMEGKIGKMVKAGKVGLQQRNIKELIHLCFLFTCLIFFFPSGLCTLYVCWYLN